MCTDYLKCHLFIFTMVLSLFMVSNPAFCESRAIEKKALAAFTEGSRLFDAGQYIKAAEQFRKAQSLSPSWKIFYNIGQCEAAASRYGLALDAFELYLSKGGDEITLNREQQIIEEIKNLKAKVGRIQITAPDDAVIFVDGTKRGTAPLTEFIRVSAGQSHNLVVKQENTVIFERAVKVWTDDTANIIIPKEGESESAETVLSDKTSESVTLLKKKRLFITGWTLLGVGGATLIAGGVLSGITMSKARQLKDDCPDNVCSGSNDQQRIDDATTLGTLSTVLLSAGGTLATSAVIFLTIGKKYGQSESLSVSLSPTVSSSFNGFILKGRF